MSRKKRALFAGLSAAALGIGLLGVGTAPASAAAGEPLPPPDFLKLDYVELSPETYTGPCGFEGFLAASIGNYEQYVDKGYEEEDLVWVATLKDADGNLLQGFDSAGSGWVAERPVYTSNLWHYFWIDSDSHPFPSGPNTLTAEVELRYRGTPVATSAERSVDFELTAGCAEIGETAWDANPVVISSSDDTGSATLTGRVVNRPEKENFPYRYELAASIWPLGAEQGIDYQEILINDDGSWSVTFSALPPGKYWAQVYLRLFLANADGAWTHDLEHYNAPFLEVTKEESPTPEPEPEPGPEGNVPTDPQPGQDSMSFEGLPGAPSVGWNGVDTSIEGRWANLEVVPLTLQEMDFGAGTLPFDPNLAGTLFFDINLEQGPSDWVSGPFTVCVDGDADAQSLFHLEDLHGVSTWVDITGRQLEGGNLEHQPGRVCGQVEHFSPFVLAKNPVDSGGGESPGDQDKNPAPTPKPDVPGASAPEEGLAKTGASVGGALLLGAAAIGLGGIVHWRSRRVAHA